MAPSFDDDERPTQPDLNRISCPSCRDERGVPVGTVLLTSELATGHRSKRVTCPICRGTMFVTRQEFVLWRARSR